MKKKILGLVFSILVLMFFNGCQNDVDDTDSYTVWTDVGTYSEFTSAFNTTLNDGMYVRLEFTNSQWNQINPSLTNEGKHNWSQDKIKDWLTGRGFGDYEANKESSWFATIDHGFIASRTENTVYFIMK